MNLKTLWQDLRDALRSVPRWECYAHIFWLSGPFILLIERTPADIWVVLLGFLFVARSIAKRDKSWLSVTWVRLSFIFWAVCLLAATLSALPFYSFGEAFVWFRFPLFAMAVVFWLGRDKRLVYAMLAVTAVALLIMSGIAAAEMILIGRQGGRLSWPYGDMIPGSFLAKTTLPAFLVIVAITISARHRVAAVAAVIAVISIIATLMTGERINFLIIACGGMLAALAWKPKIRRVASLLAIGSLMVGVALLSTPGLLSRFVIHFISEIPVHADSVYYRAMAPGVLAFMESPLLGVGPGNLRILCPELIAGSSAYDCHPHPHNYYLQILGEAGIVGLMTGALFLCSIIWACVKPALYDRSNVVVATMWIVPVAFFWPIASTADFFGQWNNIFMWSALAVALAGAQVGSKDRSDKKT